MGSTNCPACSSLLCLPCGLGITAVAGHEPVDRKSFVLTSYLMCSVDQKIGVWFGFVVGGSARDKESVRTNTVLSGLAPCLLARVLLIFFVFNPCATPSHESIHESKGVLCALEMILNYPSFWASHRHFHGRCVCDALLSLLVNSTDLYMPGSV